MSEIKKQQSPISVPPYLVSVTSLAATRGDCGTCQSTTQSCGGSQHGSCSSCEGFEGCTSACEKSSQGGCSSGCEVTDEGGCAGGQCSSSQSCHGCERAQGCGGCEDGCQDSQCDGCQTSSEIAKRPEWSCSATGTTITATITDTGAYSYFSWGLRTASGTVISAATSYSRETSKTYAGLSPNTTYRVYLSWSTSTTGEGNYTYQFVTTAAISIALWDWSTSNGTASKSETIAAYDVINNPDSSRNVAHFSHKVWNDMVNKTLEAWKESGESWNTKYLTAEQTLMTQSDRTLTAARFNSLRHNIGINQSTGINEVAPGDTVYGWYFERLTNRLNEWIKAITQ